MPPNSPNPVSAFTEVVVPCTPEGMVSAPDQETLVRWLRGQGFAGVVLQGPLSRGDRFDLLEREEIHSSWRSGLPPTARVLVAVPPEWRILENPASNLPHHATTAREWGADGIVLPDWVDASQFLPGFRELELGVFQTSTIADSFTPTRLNPIIGTENELAPVVLFPAGAFLGCLARQAGGDMAISTVRDCLAHLPPGAASQLGLWILEWGGIISRRGSCDPYCPSLPEDSRQRVHRALADSNLHRDFLKVTQNHSIRLG